MNALILQPQLSGSRRPPFGSDFPPCAVGPDPEENEFDGTQRLLCNIELSLSEKRIGTRMDADNLLALLESRQSQVEQELLWCRLIGTTVIRSLNGEMASFDDLLNPIDTSEEQLTSLLSRIHELRTRLLVIVDEPNRA
jgi:hypothetical protein